MAGTLSVQKIQGLASSATPTTVEIASGHKLHAPGHVIQVVQTAHKGASTFSSTSFQNITDLALTITPISTSSKIFLQYHGFIYMSNYTRYTFMSINRNIGGAGDADISGSTVQTGNVGSGFVQRYDGFAGIVYANQSFSFLDSPSTTSSIVYHPTIRRGADSVTITHGHSNQVNTFTAMEIAQ